MTLTRRFQALLGWLSYRYHLFWADTLRNSNEMLERQAETFRKHGLDRVAGLNRIDMACRELFGKGYDENDGMYSEHLVILAAVSVSPHYRIKSILEIGTFDGRTAAILSKLFSGAEIVTVDLPDVAEDLIGTYDRKLVVDQFISSRNGLLSRFPAVSFHQMNSVKLAEWANDAFDLIWIDGAHGYPVVAMDIINSLRLAKGGGLILIDDVWTDLKVSDPIYSSLGAYESLLALESAGLIPSFELFLKRLHPCYNVPRSKKFVGWFVKPLH